MPTLTDAAANELMDRYGAAIAADARAAFRRLLRLISDGVPPRDAIKQVQERFSGAYVGRLSAAFSELLQRSVSAAEIRAMPVGGIALSKRLYAHNVEVANEVTALVRQHAQGMQDARALALRLYDGYNPQDGIRRPLEGAARAELPRALRAITQDRQTRQDLGKMIEEGQKRAARLKTPALRAAYAQAFDDWQAGASESALRRRLDVAQREKNRFMANRIAQHELAIAHQKAVGEEMMADEMLEVVQVTISPTHPRVDICDAYARADLYGLGPGCYPKGDAPRPAYHPFCRCKLTPKYSLSASGARAAPGGVASYLRGMPIEEAARVMGSRERAQRVLAGAGLDEVVNAGRPDAYRVRRLGGK